MHLLVTSCVAALLSLSIALNTRYDIFVLLGRKEFMYQKLSFTFKNSILPEENGLQCWGELEKIVIQGLTSAMLSPKNKCNFHGGYTSVQ